MAGEGYGALLPPPPPAPLDGNGGGSAMGGAGAGWLVLRKHLLQWLLAVSARCGDVRASSEYFAGLAELMAALEEERGKADRECRGGGGGSRGAHFFFKWSCCGGSPRFVLELVLSIVPFVAFARPANNDEKAKVVSQRKGRSSPPFCRISAQIGHALVRR